MKSGDLVKIYQKPITKEDYEGEARLVKRIPFNLPGFERWEVHFVNDMPGQTYERNIYIKEA